MALKQIRMRTGRTRTSDHLKMGGNGQLAAVEELPLRAELLSLEQLKQHAAVLGSRHEVDLRGGRDQLRPRLAENEAVLLRVYEVISEASRQQRRLPPAAEWLLDNFHIVEEQVRTARKHLPKRYSRQLPRLRSGPSVNLPRVYDIALELISHGDGSVDDENLSVFVGAYQTVSHLKLGELWAVPIMLRLALIENLRRVATRVAAGRADHENATDWATRMLQAAEQEPGKLVLVLADMVRAEPRLSSAFVAEFARRLQGRSPRLVLPLTWLQQRLSERGQTIESLVQQESQEQAADQVSIGNSISSLRFLSSANWREFVESQSSVEQTLRGDPAGVYANMDFATRDRYRHAVEELVKVSSASEEDVARIAVEMARVRLGTSDDRTGHVGYYLVGKGRGLLERAVEVGFTPSVVLRRLGRRYPLALYLGCIMLVTGLATAIPLWQAGERGLNQWQFALLLLPLLLTASYLGVAATNWLATVIAPPRHVPRLDYARAIPADARTLVVVPTFLSSSETLAELLQALEVRFLGNRHEHLYFGLLTDFPDASAEILPNEQELLQSAKDGIAALNQKYDSPSFFLFHRPRRWNEQEKLWMGWERKRGKLTELNSLLRGNGRHHFSAVVGEQSILPTIRYVITLDTDTQLPPDSAHQLIGTMAHPLNRPLFDTKRNVVVDGYGILQPRVGSSLTSATRSRFARLFAPDAGMDPYTMVVSNVYQDIFGEGSFIGKGIYDVAAFEKALNARLPENRILSHDLLEGGYARCGLVSDVLLFEGFPANYLAEVSRRHRWMRGDWQIASWVLRRVPGPHGKPVANPLSALSQWKIFDNLRRSLVPAATIVLLLIGWLGTGMPLFWTVWALLLLLGPVLLGSLSELAQRPSDLPLLLHLRWASRVTVHRFAQTIYGIACLPFEAYVSLDAVIRTLVRIHFTRQMLLEWQTAGDAERLARTGLIHFLRTMWFGPVPAIVVLAVLAMFNRTAFWAAAPLAALWIVAPLAAWEFSRRLVRRPSRLSERDFRFLHGDARRTWRFFETFVTAADHFLPPDNYQEYPSDAVAHRTSPTNIGLGLLANLAAYDLGYISVSRLLERSAATLTTMQHLRKYHGHLLNWYNTMTLEPLAPQYVSSVDSGNLWGALLVLRNGLQHLADEPILSPRIYKGVQDTLQVLAEQAEKASRSKKPMERPPADLLPRLQQLGQNLQASPSSPAIACNLLHRLQLAASSWVPALGTAGQDLRWWAEALEMQCRDSREYLATLGLCSQIPAPGGGNGVHRSDEQLRRQQTMRSWFNEATTATTLRELAALDQMLPAIEEMQAELRQEQADDPSVAWLAEFRSAVEQSSAKAAELLAEIERLAGICDKLADMDFEFLYDRSRHLLAIGYNVTDHRRDTSFYDLLASEARLCSYLAVASGKLPYEHWFSLGRLVTTVGADPVLLSWSGSMFEYLMPPLFMPSYRDTLLEETYEGVIRRQIEYTRPQGIPWGISESGYNATDQQLNYQYRAFGVPGLGFKRGLSDDLVIAPYASHLALVVAPSEACKNLQRLAAENQVGRYGFYEAVDYTPSRVPRGQTHVTVQSFMAHHQAMSLLSLVHVLLDRPMQRRMLSDPMVRACELLLQERIPRIPPVFPHPAEATAREGERAEETARGGMVRALATPHTPVPELHLLSNGRYHVVISAAGGGYSRWKDMAISRWRADPTQDCWGTFCYVRDVDRGRFWSVTYQPSLKPSRHYQAIFSQARAEFRRSDDGIMIHTEISVSPEDDIELRRVSISNHSRSRRTIELTSYMEVVLAPPEAEATHPAFANLFVQTEILDSHRAILCTRRSRSSKEQSPWMFHLIASHGATGEAFYETSREQFLGRGRDPADPAAMHLGHLTGSQGCVLDPIVSVRRTVSLEPDQTVQFDVVTGVAETREATMALVEKYHDHRLADRVFELAWTHKQVALRQLRATESDAQLYAHLVGSILYPNAALRAPATVIARNRRGQSELWGYGVSGDLPIILLRVSEQSGVDLARQLIQAHTFWRLRGLAVDLVIWNEDHSAYRQELQDQITGLVTTGADPQLLDRPGGIFVRRIEQISDEDRTLFQSVARVVLSDSAGRLEEQVAWRQPKLTAMSAERPRVHTRTTELTESPPPSGADLAFFNGFGGFTGDGREYRMTTTPRLRTPAPWSNVIGNANFGTVVTESGGGYTWMENAHEFRLTPWYNDAVTDRSGENFYLRDEESGLYWSPCPLPARGPRPYLTRHGFGYSVFEYADEGIESQLSTYIATDAPVKFFLFKVRNTSGETRRLSLTGFVEWVLGAQRTHTLMHVATELHGDSSAILARNPYNTEFPDRVAFFNVSENTRMYTGDRAEFLGRNGSYANPAAMESPRLSGAVGAALDPCAALRVEFELEDQQEREIVFTLGAGHNLEQAQELIQRFSTVDSARRALEGVWAFWNHTLGAVHVETPDPSINYLVNGWLLYQVLSCRFWARSGFYQSGGAFGFRDQLQDVLALLHTEPPLVREHLLRCAAHQFKEGDVLHWWHPPLDRGVRTRISDDYLWLPYATAAYVRSIGDTGVLDEQVPFLEGRPVKPEEDGYYDLPVQSEESGTLYEHCVRAIHNGLRFGEHGLPLMGAGDWNDGMNLVGDEGRGESVWLAFFLCDVLQQFSEIARQRGDDEFADFCMQQHATLVGNIEQHTWDGNWYRRAYFDDGTPLGSASSPECQIDGLPQCWSAIARIGDPARGRTAMRYVEQRLVRRDWGLIQLFDPPFDASYLDPGYIKGYPPGVRENGGQYTHAAVWTVMGFAAMGDVQRAWELLRLINPIHHGDNRKAAETYRVEPYVLAGDVYANPEHLGRGGWSWYTGSAGWLYRLIVEQLLGLRLTVDRLYLEPRLPKEWKSLQIHYRYRETFYHIAIQHQGGTTVTAMTLDGAALPENAIPLIDDRRDHTVTVQIG